jgi:hypothetical protein
MKSIQDINLQNGDCLVSFDVVSLFTNVPVEEVLEVMRNRLSTVPSLSERSPLQVGNVMELLDICVTITHFQFEDNFYQQKEGMAMGNYLWWPHGPAKLQQFLHHINSIRPTIKFSMEFEVNDTLPFLDVLGMKQGPKLTTKAYSYWLLLALQVQSPTSSKKGSRS